MGMSIGNTVEENSMIALSWILFLGIEGALLGIAVRFFLLARPSEPLTQRYRNSLKIVNMEPLRAEDVFRTTPYRLDVELGFPDSPTSNGYYLSIKPTDLDMAMARWAWRSGRRLPVWVSVDDPTDLRFDYSDSWNTEKLARAATALGAALISAFLAVFHRSLILADRPGQSLLYLLAIAALAGLFTYAVIRAGAAATARAKSVGNPVTAEARIDGVHQVSTLSGRVHQAFEVFVTYLPPRHPAQTGVVRIPGYERRTVLVLKALIEKQLADEEKGIVRAWRPERKNPPKPKVMTVRTPEGPSTVKFTRLDPTDPRADARPEKARKKAEKARRKAEKAKLVESRAQIRKAQASQWTWEGEGMPAALRELIDRGPQVWYYPADPAKLFLLGVSSQEDKHARQHSLQAAMWIAISVLAVAGIIYLGINPGTLFPVHETPPPGEMILGPWSN